MKINVCDLCGNVMNGERSPMFKIAHKELWFLKNRFLKFEYAVICKSCEERIEKALNECKEGRVKI